MKYLPLIRRIDLSTIDRIFKDLCGKHFICGDTDERYNRLIVRMTSSVVLQNMLDGNTVDYDQEQMSKITTEIKFYIKEELQEYFDGYVKLRRKRC